MKTPNTEIVACLLIGFLLLVVGEAFYAQGSLRVAFALVSGAFLLAPPALGLALHRAPRTRLSRAAAWVVWATSAVLVVVHVYGAFVAARLPVMIAIGMPSLAIMVVGLALGAVAVVRAGLQSGLVAAAVPLSVPVWLGLEQAFPAWGGIAGAAVFGIASATMVWSMRRRLATPLIDAVSRTGS